MPRFNPNPSDPVINYLNFSRSQRRAMLMVLIVSLGIFLVIRVAHRPERQSVAASLVATGKMATLLQKDSVQGRAYVNYPDRDFNGRKGRKPLQPAALKSNLSFFDPNTAEMEELLALGMSEKAAKNLVHYREKGGRFRKPDDLSKLYSLKAEEAERLMPYVKIEAGPETAATAGSGMTSATIAGASTPFKARPIPVLININRADSTEWQLLPGIGAKRAASILKFRQKLGGFVSVDQVGETYGLPDSVFSKIKANLSLTGEGIVQISLNNATEVELKAHPYIGWQMAKIMVAYRNQHGPYQSVDDLMKIHIINTEWLERVRPYLKAD